MKKVLTCGLVLLSAFALASCKKNPSEGGDSGLTDVNSELESYKKTTISNLNTHKDSILSKLGIAADSRLDSIINSAIVSIGNCANKEAVDNAVNEAYQNIGNIFPQAQALMELEYYIDSVEKSIDKYDIAEITVIEKEAIAKIKTYNTYQQTKGVIAEAEQKINAIIETIKNNLDAIDVLRIRSSYFKSTKLQGSYITVADWDLPTSFNYLDFITGNDEQYTISWRMEETSDYASLSGNTLRVTRPANGDGTKNVTVIGRISNNNAPDVIYDFESVFSILEEGISAEQIGDIAAQNIYIPANLEGVVSDLNLPTKAYCGDDELSITWTCSTEDITFEQYDKNDLKIEVVRGKVKRPAVGSSSVKTVLTASISGYVNQALSNGKFDSVRISKTQTFDVTILPEEERKTYDFIEDFSIYEDGTAFSDVRSPYWEYIEEQKRVTDAKVTSKITNIEGVEFNNTIGNNKALKVASNVANEAKFDAYVALPNSFVMETYILSVDGGNTFNLDFRSNGSSIFAVGAKAGYLTVSTKSTDFKLDDGVWYRLRVEYDNGQIVVKYYDYETNSLQTITTETVTHKNIDLFRIGIPALEDTGLSYVSNIQIMSELAESFGTDPNRTDGLGEIKELVSGATEDSEFDDYVVIDKGSVYTLPEIVVYNRFNLEEKYSLGVDYSVTTTTYSNGVEVTAIDTSTTGTYEVVYKIDALFAGYDPAESKTIKRTVSVQEIGAESKIENFNVSVVRSGNVTLKGDLTRENTKFYYLLLDEKNSSITAEQIKNDPNARSFTVESNKLKFDISASVGKYLYLVTEADNGIVSSVIYQNMDGDTVVPLSDVIKLKTAEQVYNLCTNKDTQNDKFELACDIDMTGYSWGQSPVVFGGVLDGKGFTIRNITNKADDIAGGMFYSVDGGTIKNIKFENCEITASAECGLFGKESNGGTFKDIDLINVTVYGNNEINSTGYVGALVGRARKAGTTTTIEKVSLVNDADHRIESSRYTGGLLGGVENADVVMKNCYVKSKLIDTRQCTGGLIGRVKTGSNVTISKCLINVQIVSYKYSGFIIGENEVSQDRGSTISEIAFAGTINGGETNKKNFGLIAGRLQGKFISISGLLSLGARLGTNSIGEIIDNSQDNLVQALDKGRYSTDGTNEVAINYTPGATYMEKYNTANALDKKENCEAILSFLAWGIDWQWNAASNISLIHPNN